MTKNKEWGIFSRTLYLILNFHILTWTHLKRSFQFTILWIWLTPLSLCPIYQWTFFLNVIILPSQLFFVCRKQQQRQKLHTPFTFSLFPSNCFIYFILILFCRLFNKRLTLHFQSFFHLIGMFWNLLIALLPFHWSFYLNYLYRCVSKLLIFYCFTVIFPLLNSMNYGWNNKGILFLLTGQTWAFRGTKKYVVQRGSPFPRPHLANTVFTECKGHTSVKHYS